MNDEEIGVTEKSADTTSSSNFPKIETDRVGRLRQLLNKFKRTEKTGSSNSEMTGNVVSGERIQKSLLDVSKRIGLVRNRGLHGEDYNLGSAIGEVGGVAVSGRIGVVEVSDTRLSDTEGIESLDSVLPKGERIYPNLERGSLFTTAELGLYRYSLPYTGEAITGYDRNRMAITKPKEQQKEYFIAAQDINPFVKAFAEPTFINQLAAGEVRRDDWAFKNFASEVSGRAADTRHFESEQARKDADSRRAETNRVLEVKKMGQGRGD